MLSHWPVAAWQPQLPEGWTLSDTGDRRVSYATPAQPVTHDFRLPQPGRYAS